MSDSGRAIRSLCQRCGQWREQVNQETEWTCRECHLEAQWQRLLALVETRGREREEARAVAREYHAALWSCFNQCPELKRLPEALIEDAKRLPWLEETP